MELVLCKRSLLYDTQPCHFEGICSKPHQQIQEDRDTGRVGGSKKKPSRCPIYVRNYLLYSHYANR